MQQEKEIDPKRGALEIKHKVLLVDDWVVEERSHLVRRVQKFTKANQGKPVLEQTLPWEDIGMGFWGAVLHEPKLGMLRMYYHSWANTGISLATSVDGVHWTKPNLGITDVDAVLLTPEGRICPKKAAQETFILPVNNSSPFPRHLRGTANNLLRYRLGNPHWIGNSLAVTTSGSEHRNSSMRYIATYDCSPKNAESGTCISGSEDGVNFNTINGGRPISGRAADTLNTIVFDEQTSRYLLYTRTDFGTSGGWREIRGHRTMSSNLSSFPTGWKTEREWYFDFEGKDEKDRRQMYSLSTFIHEGVHFGIMSVMQYPRDVSEGGFDTHRRHSRDVVDVFWATSRNGLDWKLDWVYRDEPFLDRGADGTWDKDIIVPAASIVTFKGRHWFYYMGCNERHEAQSALTSLVRANSDDVGRDVLGWRERWAGVKKAVGAASTLIDRFMYLIPESPSGQGWLVTKPLRVHGEHLEVNCNATAGWIRVLILEPNTETAIAESEDMHHVDSTRIQVKFQQQDSHWEDLENEIIRLKFVLFNAKLYAFDFAH